ncbi:MAG: GNAT family N-acetyltransferase [Oscillospiraceae bacterium]|nr:GNAT family N-acetyltransferase [Oscillospiraceae bacterium]
MIRIRDATMADCPRLLEIYGYYVLHTAISFEYTVPSAKVFGKRMENTMRRYPYLVAEEDGTVLGYAYAGPFAARAAYDWDCEVTVYVDRSACKRGVGRCLYGALQEALERMGMVNMYACVAYPEQDDEYLTGNSMDFHRHMGYEELGRFPRCGYKFGRWYHMSWLGKRIGTYSARQPAVRPYKG